MGWPYKAILPRLGQVYFVGMDESKTVTAVIARLKALRESQGISQMELSRRTGLSRSGIRHMEDGDVTPTLVFLLRVANGLEVNLSEILEEAQQSQQ